jgi:hypothetical protein
MALALAYSTAGEEGKRKKKKVKTGTLRSLAASLSFTHGFSRA